MSDPREEQQSARLLDSLRWWDADRPVASAREWLLVHRAAARKIRLSQWEALRRIGQDSITPGEYKEAVRGGWSREKPGRDPEPRWPDLLDALLNEITHVSLPDAGNARKELDVQLAKLPTRAQSVRDRIAVEQARAFVGALVTQIQAEQALNEDATEEAP